MYNNKMMQQNIKQQAEHNSNTQFQFVTNIHHDGPDRISFWVGDVYTFKQLNRSWLQNLLVAIILAVIVLVPLYICSIDFAAGFILLIAMLTVVILLGCYWFVRKARFSEVSLYFDRRMQRIELSGVKLGSRYPAPPPIVYLEHPRALNVAYRHFPQKPDPRANKGGGTTPSFRLLTLAITGSVGAVDEYGNRISNHIVVDYEPSKRWDIEAKRVELATAFQFLAEWLDVPLIIEPQMMSEYSNTRHYF